MTADGDGNATAGRSWTVCGTGPGPTSLLASAGVAGIIAGVAARSTLGNLVAGVQIAVTEPIRFDDVVIVEGEWGRTEEITLTYVGVRIWDQRRLVLPTAYFVESPFQGPAPRRRSWRPSTSMSTTRRTSRA